MRFISRIYALFIGYVFGVSPEANNLPAMQLWNVIQAPQQHTQTTACFYPSKGEGFRFFKGVIFAIICSPWSRSAERFLIAFVVAGIGPDQRICNQKARSGRAGTRVFAIISLPWSGPRWNILQSELFSMRPAPASTGQIRPEKPGLLIADCDIQKWL